MSFIPVFDYGLGLAIFGFLYWLLDGGLLQEMTGFSQTGNVYDIALYMWEASLIIYLVFGAIWLPRKFNEEKYKY